MKLHLPKGLRRALLACLAVYTLPAVLPTTVGTASGVAVAWIIASQYADATDVLITNKKGDQDSYNGALTNSNSAGNKWIFDMPSTEDFNFGVDGNQSPTHQADFEFRQTLTVNNGFNNSTNTFAGNFTGSAGADLLFVSWGSNVTNTWRFNGDLSQFYGSIRSSTGASVTAGVLNVIFGEGAETNAGAIKQEGSSKLNLTLNGQTLRNSGIDVNNLTLNKNFILDMDGGTIKSGTVILGGDVTMKMDGRTKLDWGAFNAAGHTLTIDWELSDADIGQFGSENYGYKLFGEQWTGGTDHIVLSHTKSKGGRVLRLNTDGTIVYETDPTVLEWDASNNTLEWSPGKWYAGETYDPTQPPDLHLTGLGGTVKISENVTAVHVNIDGEGVYIFTGSGEKDVKLTLAGILTLADGCTMQIEQGLTVSIGSFTGGGTLTLNGGTLQFTGDSEVAKFVLTENGGTIGVEAGATVKLKKMESGADRVLTVSGAGTIDFVDGGELASLNQLQGVGTVNVAPGKELILHEDSSVGGALCFLEGASGTLELGGNFEAKRGLKDRDVAQQTEGSRSDSVASHVISSQSDRPIQVVIGEGQTAESEASILGGGVRLGDSEHQVNLIKKGEGHQQFGHGRVEVNGDVCIEAGTLRIALSSSAEFRGDLSGSGTLAIIDSQLRLKGSSNQIGTLQFSNGDVSNTLILERDLTVESVGFCGFQNPTSSVGDGKGSIRNGNTDGTAVFLLLNPDVDEDVSIGKLYSDYYHEGMTGVTIGDGVGIGKGGDRDLKLHAENEKRDIPAFKLAGTGTLTWTGGEQVIKHFTGELGTDLTTGKITGPTLRVSNGKLTFSEVSGELSDVILDVSGGGKPTLKFGGGTLRAQTLTAGAGATLEIDLGATPYLAGWLDLQSIIMATGDNNDPSAPKGPFTLKFTGTGVKQEVIQLFVQNDKWSEHLMKQLIGEDGTGHAWTDLFRIELDRELVKAWWGDDVNMNDLSFRIDSRGRLLIVDMTVDYLLWVGTEDDVWDRNQKNGWENGTNTGEGKNVRFREGSSAGDVFISGPVGPKNVEIQSGIFFFREAKDGNYGLLMGGDGVGSGILHIAQGAVLHLNLRNSRIPSIDLEGTLGLGHAEALPQGTPSDPGTKLQFNGGMLLYDTPGVNTDVSKLVDKEGSGAVRVGVDAKVIGGVKWGDRGTEIEDAESHSVNMGLEIALGRKGLEKDGDGSFTLAWKDDGMGRGKDVNITVKAGTLTLDVGRADVGGTEEELRGRITGSGTLVIGGESKITLSGNNDVAGIVLNAGTETTIVGETALGGKGTTLTLGGGKLIGSEAVAGAGKVKVTDGTTTVVKGVTLEGAVEGGGTLAVEESAGLAGDLSGYNGELQTGTGGIWTLSKGALVGQADMAVSGSGVLRFEGAGTFGGEIRGAVTLRGSGSEALTIVSKEDGEKGARLAGAIALGNAETQAVWWDKEVLSGSAVYLGNVLLQGSALSERTGSALFVRTATARTRPIQDITVDVNGMDAGQLDGITINGHGQLTGIAGEYTSNDEHKLELHFARENVDTEAVLGEVVPAALSDTRPKRALIDVSKNGEGSNFTLTSSDDTGRSIWVDSDGVSAILAILATSKDPDNPVNSYLHVMNGGTLNIGGLELSDIQGNEVEILRSLKVEFSVDIENRNLVFTGSAADVFIAPAGSFTLDDGAIIEAAKATVLSDENTDFTLNLDGATYYGESKDANLSVHNLLGVTGSQLHLRNSNKEERLTIAFDNTKVDDIRELGQYEAVDGTTVKGQHTRYNGSIDAGEGVDVTKTGYGTLSVGGTYKLTDGTTTIRQGALELRGTDNSTQGLVFDYTEATQQTGQGEDARGLLLQDGVTTVRGEISDVGVNRGEITLTDAELVLNGQSTLEGTVIESTEGSIGRLTLRKEEGAAEGTPAPSLHLSGANVAVGETGIKTVLSGVDAEIQDGALVLSDGAAVVNGTVTVGTAGTMDLGNSVNNSLNALDVSGTLKSTTGGVTTISGTAIIRKGGKLDSSTPTGGAGSLKVLNGGELTLDNVTTTAKDTKKGWGIEVETGGKLTIDVSANDGNVGNGYLTLGEVNLGRDNTVTFRINTDTYNRDGSTITGDKLTYGEGTTVILEAVAGNDSWDTSRELTLGEYTEIVGNEKGPDVQLKGNEFFLSEVLNVVREGGKIIVNFKDSVGRKLLDALPNGAKNALAGASIAEKSLLNKTKGKGRPMSEVMVPGSDYAGVMSYFIAKYDAGETPSTQRELAAFAGASTSILAPAFSEDLHRQLSAIRNRTTSMGNEVVGDNYEKLPLWHAWINAEGNYRKLDADSLAPGYTLNSWGGTLGADADLSAYTTVGFAISAMYGDLKADAADTAKGDLDTTYLSAFVRTTRGAWIHSFVASVGMANVKLNRTVNYGTGSYTTHSDTDGYAFGAMYEIGYTGFVNKSGTAALQPVVNVEVRHVELDGYSETGSDAGLDVDDIDSTVLTFGAGARAQAAVGTNAFNRTTVLETRLLLKFDVGDRSGTANNAITGDTARGEVESAEVGSVGAEFGVGISVPISAAAGSIFADGSLEYRKGQTSANASVGYRVTF